jgi:hypothetical protein
MVDPYITGIDLRKLRFGQLLNKATATLPATAYGTLFTVSGGRIILTSLLGEVTVVIQSQATTLKFTATPTVGTAVDMSGTVDMNAKEVGTLVTLTGLPSDAAYAPNAGLGQLPSRMLYIPIGTLGITTGATSTGSIKWSMTYIPLDDGATVA